MMLQAVTPAPGPKVLLQDDYVGWLQGQKAKWRTARSERKRRRAVAERQVWWCWVSGGVGG